MASSTTFVPTWTTTSPGSHSPNVRIAAVIRRVSGPTPGFLLTGRSLRFVEEQEDILRNMVFGGWFLVVFLLIAGAALLHRSQLKQPIPN
jgi:hypothetical protein